MIVVTGANGQLGRAIVEDLRKRLPADQIAVSVRDVDKAKSYVDQAIQVRAADFAQPMALAASFKGADQVLIVSVDKLGEEAHRLHRAAIEAARDAGAGRILIPVMLAQKPDRPLLLPPTTQLPKPSWLAPASHSRRCATASMPKVPCT